MHKLRLTVLVIVSVFWGKISVAQQSSSLNGKEVTVHNFMFVLTDEFQLYLQDLAEDNILGIIAPDRDPVTELFMHKSYDKVVEAIESTIGCDILAKETLEGKVIYDIYGYPFGSKKKAVKRGSTPYYLKLHIQMSARDIVDQEVGLNNNSYQKRKIKAHVAIKATVYDNEGNVVFKSAGKAKGNRWIVLDQVSLFGFIDLEGQTIVDEQATLLSVLDEAIEDLKGNLRAMD